MSNDPDRKIILALSLPSAVLMIGVSYAGLFIPGAYAKETLNWTAQAVGQDAVDLLLISPLLLLTAILAARGSRAGMFLWSGISLYGVYTFAIYCFDVHFTRLFIAYCSQLGLSVYSFAFFLHSYKTEAPVHQPENSAPAKATGVYLIVVASIFYLLWLAQIIPSIIHNTAPSDVVDSGLPTSPVHVLDLAVFLPGIILIGIFVLRRNPLGFLLAPAALVFVALMCLTIAVLMVVMSAEGFQVNMTLVQIMSLLAMITLVLLYLFLRRLLMKAP
ncbi:MAG TPA: hypothetical protein VMF88_14445 [Bacteroidota bacterium]|nr:hypothetical protein [Bacteroidota bacterium]